MSFSLPFMLRAFNSRPYRLFFLTNGVSLFGTWMHRMSMSWLVYRLTDSPVWLGLVDFSGMFTAFLLMPFAGAILDLWDLRLGMLLSQTLGMVQAVLLGILTLTGQVEVWQVMILSVLSGIFMAMDMPGRHAIVPRLVARKEDLNNAIALNSSLFNCARLVGPSLAGMMIARFGEGICFLFNGLAFGPNLLVFWHLKEIGNQDSSAVFTEQRPISALASIREGISYVRHHAVICPILWLAAASSLLGMSMLVLLPIAAKEFLGGGPETLGFLMGAMGIGALVAALSLATRSDAAGLNRIVPRSFGLFGLGLAAFAHSRHFYLSLGLMVFCGFCMVSGWTSSGTLLQTLVDDDKRSRVMSLYLMTFTGMAPIGSLLVGLIAEQTGAGIAMSLGGLSTALAAAVFLRIHRADPTFACISPVSSVSEPVLPPTEQIR